MRQTAVDGILLIAVVAVLLAAAVGRELIEFLRWKRRVSQIERQEWARVIRMLRE